MEEGSWAIALVMVPCQAQSSRLSLTSLLDQLLLLAINKPLSKRPLRSTFDWRERAEREVFLSIFIHTHHTSSLATHTHIYTQPRHSTLAISWVTPSIGSLHLFFFLSVGLFSPNTLRHHLSLGGQLWGSQAQSFRPVTSQQLRVFYYMRDTATKTGYQLELMD